MNTPAECKKLLFDAGMNQEMLAEKLDIKQPYVSAFFTGRGHITRKDRQMIHDYFIGLRGQNE